MAVYTKISKENLISFLNNYEIGNLEDFEGILEGVENTNYKLTTTEGKFILTIFEKRVNQEELPFFVDLQKYLSSKKIKCPMPVSDKKNQYINKIKNKNSIIMSFLHGTQLQEVLPSHCYLLGEEIARIHKETINLHLNRKNNLDQLSWNKIFVKCKQVKKNNYSDLYDTIEKELLFLQKNWPNNLPKGIIHADIFQDNVFFINNKLSGLIDFYFACNDFFAYELAICINAWCFERNNNFSLDRCNSLIDGYQSIHKLDEIEIKNLRLLLRGAAMRFLLTRLHDQLFFEADAFVKAKDPMEYYKILKFHQNNSII